MDNVIQFLKAKQEVIGKGKMDSEEFCKQLGVDMDGLVYLLINCMSYDAGVLAQYKNNIENLKANNERLEKLLSESCNGNGRTVQMAKVKAGMPIAKNKKKNLADLDYRIYWGATDEMLMKEYGISKSTLWRWKKELAERKKSGQHVLSVK